MLHVMFYHLSFQGGNTEFHTCSQGLVFDPDRETCVFAQDYPECGPDVPPECECECLYPAPICSEYYKCKKTLVNLAEIVMMLTQKE